MPKRTIYVRPADEALFDLLAQQGNLSQIIARALRDTEGGTMANPTPETIAAPGSLVWALERIANAAERAATALERMESTGVIAYPCPEGTFKKEHHEDGRVLLR